MDEILEMDDKSAWMDEKESYQYKLLTARYIPLATQNGKQMLNTASLFSFTADSSRHNHTRSIIPNFI